MKKKKKIWRWSGTFPVGSRSVAVCPVRLCWSWREQWQEIPHYLHSRQRRFVLHPALVTKGSRVRKLRSEVKPKTWEFQRTGRSIVGMVVGILSNRYENMSALQGPSKPEKKSLHPLGAEDVSVHTCTYVLVSTSRCMETNLFMKNAFRQLWRRITF